jgi:hypothetical protein
LQRKFLAFDTAGASATRMFKQPSGAQRDPFIERHGCS